MLTRLADVAWWAPVAAAFAGGVLAAALLLGQVYAWIQRRRIDPVGGEARP